MYRNIMFDLDGTVIDSGRAVMGSVEYALEKFGIVDQPEAKLRTFVGPSLFDSFIREYGMSDEDSQKAVDLYREDYAKGRMYDVDVYGGIPELMKTIREGGGKVLLVTSKPIPFTEKVIAHIGLGKLIDHTVAPEITDHSSNKTRLIEKAIADYGLKREECIMIGDTKYDIRGAVGAGIDSIGVTYGFGTEEELRGAGATYIVHEVKMIREYIVSHS